MDSLYNFYEYVFITHSDKRIIQYPFLGNPLPVMLILVAYWMFIKKIGPALMKDRPPYNIKPIIQVYNVFQVSINSWIFIKGIYELTRRNEYACLVHNEDTEENDEVLFYVWLYYLVKIIDLLDTVFFVLRKKFNLITTLHTYHHMIMVGPTAILVRYCAGGEIVIMGITNSFVHVFMYSYYFYCLYNESRGNIWWKKHITHLQLAQFIFLFIWHTAKLFMTGCDYPKWLHALLVLQCMMMFYMFANYYYNAFIKPKKAKKDE